MQIDDYRLRKLVVPTERSIGDSQIDPIDTLEVVVLVLETTTGERGVGFDHYNYGHPAVLPVRAARDAFEPVGERLLGESPFALRDRAKRPRGGNYGEGQFDRLVDVALWDLCGKHLDTPVYELMGGDSRRVPAYASALAYHHDEETTRAVYEQFDAMGFDAAKVKIGYPTAAEDVARLRLVRETMGEETTLMVDGNEAFSPKEAIRRAEAYADAGIDLYWFEDPILRDDVEGMRRLSEALDTRVNASDYLGFDRQARLLASGAVDVANVHGFSSGRDTATVARAHGLPVGVGNTPGEFGVHVGAALPEVEYVEYSMVGWREILDDPVEFEDGHAVAPDRPGHGLSIAQSAFEEYEQTG